MMIGRDERVQHRSPTIEGTGIHVEDIAVAYQQSNYDPEGIDPPVS